MLRHPVYRLRKDDNLPPIYRLRNDNNLSPTINLTVVVTGGTGCIGLATIRCLLHRHPHYRIHALDISIPRINKTDTDFRFVPGVTYHQVDICNTSAVSYLIHQIQPQVIIHSAGLIPSGARRIGVRDTAIRKVNLDGTKNVLNASKNARSVYAFVYTSSCDVVKGNSWADLINVREDWPLPERWDEVYSESKALAEYTVLSQASTTFKTCAIRTHGVVGPNDNNIIPLLASSPRFIRLGPGTNLYDFSSAANVGLAHVLAMENLLSQNTTANGRAFFVTDQRPLPMRQFMEMVWRHLDNHNHHDDDDTKQQQKWETPSKKKWAPVVLPLWLSYCVISVLAFVAKLLRVAPWITTNELGDSLACRYFDNTRAREVLGYVPEVDLEESIQDACVGYKVRRGKDE